jgi:phage/plasmid-like protein (TIGR03299 family)
MSAELDRKRDGTAAMAYYGETPWHGEGQRADREMTAEQVIDLAGLNWEVALTDIRAYDADGARFNVEHRRAVVRMDRKLGESLLGIVSPRYKPVQNHEAFGFFDGIVGEGKAIYHTAGSLKGGQYVWLLAKLPESFDVAGVDKVDQFLLLTNNHSGTEALTVRFTPVRVVCWNTLSAATAARGGRVGKVSHFQGTLAANMSKAAETQGFAVEYFSQVRKVYEALAAKQADTARLAAYFEQVVPIDPVKETEKSVARKQAVRAKMNDLAVNGIGNQAAGVRGTAWAAYNGVTEYIDREHGGTADNRMFYSLLGAGSDLREQALRLAVEAF